MTPIEIHQNLWGEKLEAITHQSLLDDQFSHFNITPACTDGQTDGKKYYANTALYIAVPC